MKRYLISHVLFSIVFFCVVVASHVTVDVIASGQTRIDRFEVIVWACLALAFGFKLWPLFHSDEALLRVTPDSYKQ